VGMEAGLSNLYVLPSPPAITPKMSPYVSFLTGGVGVWLTVAGGVGLAAAPRVGAGAGAAALVGKGVVDRTYLGCGPVLWRRLLMGWVLVAILIIVPDQVVVQAMHGCVLH